MFDMKGRFEAEFENSVDWNHVKPGDPEDKRRWEAECYLYRCLLNSHELPYQNPGNCSFDLNELSALLPDKEAESIFEDARAKFPRVA